MTLGTNLSLRIGAILLVGFVLLQLIVFSFTALPGADARSGPDGLPAPASLAAMTQAVEKTPPGARPALAAALDGALYTVTLANAFPQQDRARHAALERLYRPALGGRPVKVTGYRPPPRLFGGGRLRLGHVLAPLTVAVGLHGGGVLVVDSRPSAAVQRFLRRRAFLGLMGGLIVLAVLALAVRQTTRPLLTLSHNIRAFADRLDAPPLPVEGSREMRELAGAYNAMKERIAGLVAERTRILAAVAHDMRTYLTRLRLRIEFIADEGQRARAAADLGEMSALLDDTLLFAGGESPEAPPEPLDLAEELERIVTGRRETGEAVTLDMPEAPPAISANRMAFRRMIANLVDNGLRHGGRVEIAAARTPEGIAVEVRDDGPGVPPEALSRLGMPFQRLDPSRDRQTGGAGLGLAIVRALAARQGATIAFANRVPRGFAARIVFPPGPTA